MGSSKKVIKGNVPGPLQADSITTQNWLIQPTVVTFMRYDYSLIQQKILVQIICKLQNAIHEAISNKNKGLNRELSLFSDEDYNFDDPSCVTLKMAMNSFGVPKTQYQQLKDALKLLVTVPIETPIKDKNQKIWREISSLCSVLIPEDKKVSHIYIKIKKTTAQALLNLDFGFTKYLQGVVISSENSYTPRFYTYLSAFVDRGGCEWKMSELRKYLRLTDKYPLFCDFKRRVLAPAEKELKEKAHDGRANFFFEYELCYNPGRRKYGEPDILRFKIIDTASLKEGKEALEIKKKQIYDLLRGRYILMDDKFAIDLCNRITLNNSMVILDKIMELHEIFASPNNGITHKGKYAYNAIVNLFEELSND